MYRVTPYINGCVKIGMRESFPIMPLPVYRWPGGYAPDLWFSCGSGLLSYRNNGRGAILEGMRVLELSDPIVPWSRHIIAGPGGAILRTGIQSEVDRYSRITELARENNQGGGRPANR